jgi:hypothetical protein
MSAAVVDIAIMTALKGDATLTTLAPGGVFRDVAPEAVVSSALADPTAVFGIVTVQSARDSYVFTGLAYEEIRYIVKFVSPSTSPLYAQSASDRAEVVLATVTASGYAISGSRREERISFVESDGPVYWQHRGVIWLMNASPTS